jgi:hypothetical protein
VGFRVPAFPLFADFYTAGGLGGTYGLPRVHAPCNLSPGRRVLTTGLRSSPSGFIPLQMELLLPVHTDIRANWNTVVADIVEVPAGSKRFYLCASVDDVGKGFPNEYRLAIIEYSSNGNASLLGGPFPAPVPLP